MKTILTIGGTSLLLQHDINDQQMAQAIRLLKGACQIDEQTHYGTGEDRYKEEAGYFSARVKREAKAPITLALVDDSEVMSAQEFNAKAASFAQQTLPAAA